MQRSLTYFILTLWICLLHLSAWSAPPVYAAAPSQFADDFSQGFTKWTIARGDMALWSISGERAKATINTYSTLTEIVPKDEYWNPNWHNISFQFEYTPLMGADRNISFGYQNTTNWYDLHFVDNSMYLARVQNGVVTFSVTHSYYLANGQSYQMKLLLQDGHIQFFIDGKKILDELDWTFNQNFGKISLKATAGAAKPTVVQFDNILVSPIGAWGDISLNVPLLKQTDPLWKDQEYDTAHTWSPDAPSIRRWGCALTSMAMILQHHGLRNLPNGQNITPSTLNDWLKQQSDGYINGGGLNWSAVTRLTKLIHDAYGTAKLEYNRLAGNLDTLKNEITNNRPAIVEIPGHFLVADGLSADHNTIYIKDPAYVYSQFDQHHVDPLSVRQFVPSFTDLSALLIAFPDNVDVQLTNAQKQNLSELQTWSEYLQDPNQSDGQRSPTIHYLFIPKPKDSDYNLSLKNHADTQAVQIFAYDKEANVSNLSQNLSIPNTNQQFVLHYHSTTQSTLTQVMSFTQFRADLLAIKQAQQINSTYAYLQIDRFAATAEKAPTNQAARYAPALQRLLQQSQTAFTTAAYQFLSNDVQVIIRQ